MCGFQNQQPPLPFTPLARKKERTQCRLLDHLIDQQNDTRATDPWLLADIQVDVEIGRSLLYGACLALEDESAEAEALVSAAKAWMNDLGVKAAEAGLQVHGGIGYTWELDIHLHLRQARSNAVTLGDSKYHRARVASHLMSPEY